MILSMALDMKVYQHSPLSKYYFIPVLGFSFNEEAILPK